jgi:hypothetical protein
MIGYVFKDDGQGHFKNKSFGVTEQEIKVGKEQHVMCKLNYLDDKIQLNKSNLFVRVQAYHANELGGVLASFAQVVCAMLASGKYVLSANLFMNNAGQMREEAAESYFATISGAKKVVVDDVRSILFLREYQPFRYYNGPRMTVRKDPDPTIGSDYEPLPSDDCLQPAPPPAPAPPQESDEGSDPDSPNKDLYTTGYERVQTMIDKHYGRKRRKRSILIDTESERSSEDEQPTRSDDEFYDDRDSDDMSKVSWPEAASSARPFAPPPSREFYEISESESSD